MKRRFVLVDPSLISTNGHPWRYAIDSAVAAHERGYDVVALTHRDAPIIQTALPFKIDERRIFHYAFYEHDKIYSRHKGKRISAEEKLWGAAFLERKRRIERKLELAQQRSDVSAHFGLQWNLRTNEIMGRIRGLWRHFSRLKQRVEIPFNYDQFAIAFAKEMSKLRIGDGDHVFVHTATYGMLESFMEINAVLGNPAPSAATVDFIFHFGAEASDARTYLGRYGSYSSYGSIRDRLAVGAPFRTMRFWATSRELQEEASRIVDAPVELWGDLFEPRRLVDVFGSFDNLRALRDNVVAAARDGRMSFVVRAADLDQNKARAVSRACHLVQHRGDVVTMKLLYSKASIHKLRDLLSNIDFPNLELINADDNDDYIRALAGATLVMLVYDAEKYTKRVSGVLHDCAVLGVPAMVPAGTTLQSCEFAATFAYSDTDDLLGATLNARRRLARDPDYPARMVGPAREAVGGNVLERLQRDTPASILRSAAPAPIANVVMPLWGRVGSSFAMEGQVRYLLRRGYFVNQIFLVDKPVDEFESIEYFWKMLRENSENTRGCVQRIAYVDESRAEERRGEESYLTANAFDQYLRRVARAKTGDAAFDRSLMRADITIVNHVFHAQWALANTGGRKVLETHDIQSYAMVGWPLLNEATGRVDDVKAMLASEFEMLKRFDHVVNVAPEEHRVLSLANPASSLITPYIPERRPTAKFKSVGDMARQFGWDDSYRDIQLFDLLITGDAHPSNVDSVVWFIERVFKPFLSPKGVSLAVAGRVSDVIYQRGVRAPYLFCVGFVDDLESLKSLSRLAVLPDQRGTGISIKTLDAFASGMPFVATGVALRGLRDRLPEDCRSFDDPAEFAERALQALRDADRMLALSDLARRCYAAVASEATFNAAWDRVFDQLGLAYPSRAVVEPVDATPSLPAADSVAG